MRTGKDVDWSKVAFATWAIDEYYKDVPMYELVSHYVRLHRKSDSCYEGKFKRKGESHKIEVHKAINACFVDGEMMNCEDFVALFEGEETNPNPIIEMITGVNYDEYCSEVTYEGGVTELLDVKGKALLVGYPGRGAIHK